MKNIFKLLLASFLIPLLFISCKNDDEYYDWTKQEPAFRLHDTTLGVNVLYKSMEDNPFLLVWEKPANASGEFDVVISTTENFENKVKLGSSTTTTYNTTIGRLNLAMLQAGLNPYLPQIVFVRIENGEQVSNTISFSVTPYPVAGPIITAPTTGSLFTLNPALSESVVTAVTWNDYTSYGAVAVEYKVQVAAKGTDLFQDAGSVINERQINWTNQALNEVVLKTGATPGVETEVDVRVVASTTSIGGTITFESDVVTIKVIPFATNVNYFLVGDATAAAWDNSAGNINLYPLLGNHTNVNLYSYTGYFKAGGFKIIRDKGEWNPQYGAGSESGSLSTDGGSGNISVSVAGYYKLSVNLTTLSYTLEPITTPTKTYATIGIIGSATPNGWDASSAMVQSSFDVNVWYLKNISLTDGELKFRADNSWDVNWGSKEENFGTATQGGDNIPVKAGVYDIYFNDFTGAYVLVKQ